MARSTVLCVLLVVAFVQQETLATRQVINPGGEYRLDCPISMSGDPDRYIIQFFTDKFELKIFSSTSFSDEFKLVSNGTTIVPTIANHTDRYTVEEWRTGRYMLIIKNVTESDSAWYGCRRFDLESNRTTISIGSTELLVPGPFGGVFWTSNKGALSVDVARQNEIPDGAIALENNAYYNPDIACVVLVSNAEPAVNITMGRFGEPGSLDITDQFQIRSTSTVTINKGGSRVYSKGLFFSKNGQYTQTSLRDVHCRASLFNTTYDRSVNIQVRSRPKSKACEPGDIAAWLGSKNVNLTCLIEAHPEPYIEWTLPSGVQINALSNNTNYTVTNDARFEGLFTTLTISEVRDGIYDFGHIEINATNSEGSGIYSLYFKEGDYMIAAGIERSSATLITITMALLVWMLK